MIALRFLADSVPWWRDLSTVSAASTVIIAVATAFYVCFTIALWLSTRRAANAAMISAEAAKQSANAATRMAEVTAGLHRPFMGIARLERRKDLTSRTWDVGLTVRNYGTLPAVEVSVFADFILGSSHLREVENPASAEVFPQGDCESAIRFVLSEAQQDSVTRGDGIMIVRIRIKYSSADGRRYVYSAEGQFKHDISSFAIVGSKTEVNDA